MDKTSGSTSTLSSKENENHTDSSTKEEKIGKHDDNTLITIPKSTKIKLNLEDKFKTENDIEIGELLGSVTTEKCPGVRTSARVIQKMKQDLIRPTTPPPSEKELKIKEEKGSQKTPSQTKASKVIWSNSEKTMFFDALNEYGKDFEAISNYLNVKLKRKSSTETFYKTKDHVRVLYYQIFHKISKYIRFSEEVKKPVQELYALINYGEMRRKIQFVSDKNSMKLKELVYQGHVTIRNKGKNIRIKTPSCKALRKINQMEDWLDDIKLPQRIEVYLRPSNIESFGRVQSIAQNPLIRTVLPLQKKLIHVLKTFQQKWKSQETKLAEEAFKIKFNSPTPSTSTDTKLNCDEEANSYKEPELCFQPHEDAVIHRPLVSITEFLSSLNISLNSYEERLGVNVRGEHLCVDRFSNKRQRSDSGCEKRSPDSKKCKTINEHHNGGANRENLIKDDEKENCVMFPPAPMNQTSIDINEVSNPDDNLNEELEELLSDNENVLLRNHTENHDIDSIKCELIINNNDNAKCMFSVMNLNQQNNISSGTISSNTATVGGDVKQKKTRDVKCSNRRKEQKKDVHNLKPLLSESVIKKIRKGWTISNVGDITIGDLYIVFGGDSKLLLEYYWKKVDSTNPSMHYNKTTLLNNRVIGFSYNSNDKGELVNNITNSSLNNRLKNLLLIANLNERIRKRPCSCGHTCDKNGRSKFDNDFVSKSFVSNKTVSTNNCDNNIFRQPIAPFRRPAFSLDGPKQMPSGVRLKTPRLLRGLVSSRQVFVERLLPCQPIENPTNDFINTTIKENNRKSLSTSDLSKEQSATEVFIREVTASENSFNVEINSKDGRDITTPQIQVDVRLENKNFTEGMSTDAVDNSINSHNTKEFQNYVSENDADDESSPSHYMQTDQSNCYKSSNSTPLSGCNLDDSTSDSTYNSIPPFSPSTLLRDASVDSRWLEDNLNDFSLNSLLGHLDEINSSRDDIIDQSNLSVISESSVDYMTKFAEISASMQNMEKD